MTTDLRDLPPAWLERLERQACQGSFWHFCRAFWEDVPGAGVMVPNWHMELLCDEFQRVAERVFTGLPKEHDVCVNISPGTSKSTILSILGPAWCWTRMPSCRVLTASHTDSLVLDLANKARMVIKSERYQRLFPEIRLRADQDTKGYYANTLGGDRLTCTVGGKSPMGFHAHIIVVDDPLDPKKVLSDLERLAAKDFMTNIIPTRRVDKAVTATCLVMQRLGLGDPTDVMLEAARNAGASPVRHVCLPAELDKGEGGAFLDTNVEPKELAARYVGGLMDPGRLGRKVLDEYAAGRAHFYSTQFKQKPYAAEGGMFRAAYFNQRLKAAPHDAVRLRYWDRACLIAGTQITTSAGPKSIELVEPGDFVLTRRGHRRVLRSWLTKVVKRHELVTVIFSGGADLTGTKDHPVWTNESGWVDLGRLCDGAYTVIDHYSHNRGVLCDARGRNEIQTRKLLFSRGLFTAANPAVSIFKRCGGTSRTNGCGVTCCTGPFGATITERFRRGVLSTTATRTTTTMPLAIWNALPGNSTANSTEKRVATWDLLPTPITSKNPRNNGVAGGKIANLPSAHASTAAENFIPSTSTPSALGIALTARAGSEVVLPDAVPVYDLEIEGVHEFFANGILVHNSTADGGCNSAGVLLARDKAGNYYVEDCVVGQWEPHERNRVMRATALKDRARYGPQHEPKIYVEAEGGSSGRDAWKGVAAALAGFPVFEDRVSGDKKTRAEPWSAQCAALNVYLVDNGQSKGQGTPAWDVQTYVDEHCAFPGGILKDRVDASCLVAGTLVETVAGRVPIELVPAGELVLTREGYKRVLWSGQSGTARNLLRIGFGNGSELCGTADHLVWTHGKGYIRMDALSVGDKVLFWNSRIDLCPASCIRRNVLFAGSCFGGGSRESVVPSNVRRGGGGTKKEGSTSTKLLNLKGCFIGENCRMAGTFGAGANLFIERFGRVFTGIFPLAGTFTTRMEIPSITQSTIWSALLRPSTVRSMRTSSELQDSCSTWPASRKWPRRGTKVNEDRSGTGSTARNAGSTGRNGVISVPIAGMNFGPDVRDPSFAQGFVLTEIGIGVEPIRTFGSNAPPVLNGTWALGEVVSVARVALHGGGGTSVPVYDLTVEDSHEFVANGVLVHNSGAFNKLAGAPPAGTLHTFSFAKADASKVRVFVTTDARLANTVLDDRCLLVCVQDPPQHEGEETAWPLHGLSQVVDRHAVRCCDLDPAEIQDRWHEPVAPWGLPPERLILDRDGAKKLWAFLTKKREQPWRLVVVSGPDDRRARSVAEGIFQVFGRHQAAFADLGEPPDGDAKPALNKHLVELVKLGRSLVL